MNKIKSRLFKKKIDMTVARLTKIKREQTQITKIRDKRILLPTLKK